METIKSYTDISQSRKLADILPLESADMWYQHIGFSIKDGSEKLRYFPMVIRDYESDEDIPCWSLAALINVLPNTKLCHYDNSYFCQYMSIGDEFPKYSTNEYNNSIDAYYEMVLKLHELNLL